MKRPKRKPTKPNIDSVDARILEEVLDIQDTGRAQSAYYPKNKKNLDRLRRIGCMEPLDTGENAACATRVTELGVNVLGLYYDWKSRNDSA